MDKRRVAVLYTHALLGQGIAQLLQADKQLEVTCLRAGLADTCEQLKRLRPHVIVVEESEEGALLRDLVRDLPPALFIMVRLEESVMDIYYDRQVVAARPEALVEAIHHGLRKRGQPSLRAG